MQITPGVTAYAMLARLSFMGSDRRPQNSDLQSLWIAAAVSIQLPWWKGHRVRRACSQHRLLYFADWFCDSLHFHRVLLLLLSFYVLVGPTVIYELIGLHVCFVPCSANGLLEKAIPLFIPQFHPSENWVKYSRVLWKVLWDLTELVMIEIEAASTHRQ